MQCKGLKGSNWLNESIYPHKGELWPYIPIIVVVE